MKILEKVREVAEEAEGKFRFGCICLDSKGREVSRATNTYKTHPEMYRWAVRAGKPKKIALHAEIRALIRAKRNVETIYICRINRNGELRNAFPCPVCRLCIEDAGVKEIVYSTERGTYEQCRLGQL